MIEIHIFYYLETISTLFGVLCFFTTLDILDIEVSIYKNFEVLYVLLLCLYKLNNETRTEEDNKILIKYGKSVRIRGEKKFAINQIERIVV
eukprot:snap_masked-scaffold_17-processed-gene-2.35-mRNA-1 protein AED:1.00 eAED:1.00 QI:0/0/0/0/1/1/3/0/90